MASVEEKVEDFFKRKLDRLGIRYFGKTEEINPTITAALKEAASKSGGRGGNYPDIQLLLENSHGRRIPVMIEAKGGKNRLEKLTKEGEIEGVTRYTTDTRGHKKGEPNYSSVTQYAVNGALHYGKAVLTHAQGYTECIIIGINGTELSPTGGSVKDWECKAYYVSQKNNYVPKHIEKLDNGPELLKKDNLDKLYDILDKLVLTEHELAALKTRAEITLEERIKSIHQSLYDDPKLKTTLSTNEKLYLFCGLIMAGLKTDGLATIESGDFKGNRDERDNDGAIVIKRIEAFLNKKHCSPDKIKMVCQLLTPVFEKPALWRPDHGESIIKTLYLKVKQTIIPCLEGNLHLDFTGKIFNSLNDWVTIDNDAKNDVVLTPRYITTLMAKMARTDRNSFVWDRAMGPGGFLVSAMDIMIRDAEKHIADKMELDNKIRNIKEKQLLGVEILGNIYILAILNMILMGDGSSNMLNGDGHVYDDEVSKNFPATVFLLNPPYSAPGKGFNFVAEALEKMTRGYACILIQENAGAGQGLPYTKNILKNNTLRASIHMPDIFCGKAGVQTAIYVFQVNRPMNKMTPSLLSISPTTAIVAKIVKNQASPSTCVIRTMPPYAIKK